MINELRLRHFKCFERLNLPMRWLTVLTGGNGSGKSSVLQSLVLLKNMAQHHEWAQQFLLNGHGLELGTVSEVVDQVYGRHGFGLGISSRQFEIDWDFKGDRDDLSMSVDCLRVNDELYRSPERLFHMIPTEWRDESGNWPTAVLQNVSYISAERMGPRETYSLKDRQESGDVGSQGEFAANILHWRGSEEVRTPLVREPAPPTLLRQVEEWMNHFFPGAGLELDQIPRTNRLTLGLRTSTTTGFHRPIHVGFGLTQLFPVIVAALAARVGDVLMVENPEVHLHPSAQSKVGQFLGLVAHTGVQIVMETHSDHVLNGTRMAVRSELLRPSDLALHYFQARSPELSQVVQLQVEQDGRIDHWPKGFFDQYDSDLSSLQGW